MPSAIPSTGNSLRMLPALTSLRVFAALAVVVHHTRSGWAHTALIDSFCSVGWLGVSFFFVLSGFVLMWGFNPTNSDRAFISRRLIRIYPLHLLTLLASLAAFLVLRSPMAGYVGTKWGTVASFLLIHDWLPGHPNIRQAWNGVSWTLSCEFFFYLLAPLVFRLMLSAKKPTTPFIVTAIGWAVVFAFAWVACTEGWEQISDFLIYHPIPRFVEFALGASGALLLRNGFVPQSRTLALALMFIPLAAYCVWAPETGGTRSAPVMIELFLPGVLLLIMSQAARDNAGEPSRLHLPWLVYLGEASFALYMTHALLLGPFTLLRNHFFPISNTSHLWGEVITVLFVVLALTVSAITHSLIEQPIRIRLVKHLRAKPSSTVTA